MNTKAYFIVVAMVALLLFMRQGVSTSSIVAVLVVATLATIPWYFGTRDASAEPSATERVLAATWVWFRRIIGVGAGAIFLWAGWGIARSAASPSDALSPLLMGLLVAFLGLICIYIGIVGQGSNRAGWHDDLALYRYNQRRYKRRH